MHRDLHQDFFKKWSLEMAYVLGFFAADGSMLRNNRGAHFIEFNITDREVLVYIKKVIQSTHRIATRKRVKTYKTQYRLQIGSKVWFDDLAQLGFTQNKSKTLVLPIIPKQFIGDFVRGYFDGDGCVYFNTLQTKDRKNPRKIFFTLFTSGSESFLDSLWQLLRKEGIAGGSLKRKQGGFDLVFSHHDSVALYQLMYHTAPTAPFGLTRKREKLERAIRALGLDYRTRG